MKNKIISHIYHSAIRLDKNGCYQSFVSSMCKKPNQSKFSWMMVDIKKTKTFRLSPFNGYKFLRYNSAVRNFITLRSWKPHESNESLIVLFDIRIIMKFFLTRSLLFLHLLYSYCNAFIKSFLREKNTEKAFLCQLTIHWRKATKRIRL